VPLGTAPKDFGPDNRFNENYQAVARVAPGVTRSQAESYMGILTQRVTSGTDDDGRYSRASKWDMHAVPFVDAIYGNLRGPLTVLFGSVGFVLLICCANVAGLMLAKASGRAKELAIRTALGARRGHLVRQVLAESTLIAGAGTAVGIALAIFAVKNASRIAPAGSIDTLPAPLDRTVLLFSIASGVLSAVLFGLAPALAIAGAKSFELLKEGGRSAMSGRGRQRVRSALVVAEIGLALVLLVGAGLFLKSLIRTQEINPGFNARGVMTAEVSLDRKAYATDQKRETFYTALAHTLSAQPGVQSAAVIYGLSFSNLLGGSSFAIEGRVLGPGDPGPHSDISAATPDFFRTLEIPLLAGRSFNDSDRRGTEPVAIIDKTLADQYWPGQNAIGARIKRGKDWTRVIGIVGHVNRSSLSADTGKGLAYYPLSQLSDSVADIVVRTSADPVAIGQTVREAVRAVDPSQAAVYDLKPMTARLDASLGPRRFAVTMMLAFASIALFMAALGLYGVISYSVAQRTQEIGVRMALGARLSQVLWMVVAQSMRMVLVGTALGFVASLALARVVRSELVKVSSFDPLTFAGMCGVLILVTLAATYLPARRAAKVDPMVALRYE
jgi:predicted permease